MLSNHLSELAIAEWGAGQSIEMKKALGFEKGSDPPSNDDSTALSESERRRDRNSISPDSSLFLDQRKGETRSMCCVYRWKSPKGEIEV